MIPSFTQAFIWQYWPHGTYYNQLHALYREGIYTLGDVMCYTEAEILRIPVVGRGTLRVLRQVLADGMREYLEEVS